MYQLFHILKKKVQIQKIVIEIGLIRQSKFIFFKPRTQNPEPRTQNPEPRTQNPEPRTQNPEPRTQNPEPRT